MPAVPREPTPRDDLLAQLRDLRLRAEALERIVPGQSDIWVAGMAEAARFCVRALDDAARTVASGGTVPPPTD